jgi:hypothetical protein
MDVRQRKVGTTVLSFRLSSVLLPDSADTDPPPKSKVAWLTETYFQVT